MVISNLGTLLLKLISVQMPNNLNIFLFLFVVLSSCKNQSEAPSVEQNYKMFTLEANIANVSDSTRFSIKSLKTNRQLDSAYLVNGNLYLEGFTESKRPEKLLLSATDPVSEEFIYTLLMVGNEQIKFKADKKDFPWNIDVLGSMSQDKAEEFNHIEYQRQKITSELRLAYSSDKELLSEKIKRTSDSLNTVLMKLIIKNPNSYAALDFFKYHKSNFSNEQLRSLYSRLDKKLKESKEGKGIKLQSEFAKPEVGDKFYDYHAINQNGDTVFLSSIKDKYILLHFSSSACYYSQLSLLESKEIYRSFKHILEIVSISEDISREQWQHTVKRDSIPWTYLWDGKGVYSDAVIKYWTIGTPNYFLISPDRIILEKWFGYEDGIIKNKLDKHLNRK